MMQETGQFFIKSFRVKEFFSLTGHLTALLFHIHLPDSGALERKPLHKGKFA